MKKCWALLLALVVVAFASPLRAQELPIIGGSALMLPPHEIETIIRSTGFSLTGRPALRGRHYEVDATDPYDLDVRLVVSPRTGRIVAVRHEGAAPPDGVSPQAYAQNSYYRPVPPWRTNRWREGRPVPPRAVPSARSAALGAQKTPLPRPRPDERTGAAGSIASNAAAGPSGPSAAAPTGATAPSAPSSPSASSSPTVAPSGGGAVGIVPVAPLE